MFSKMLSAATIALVMTFASSTKAQASPLFLNPDVNFASTGDALFFHDAKNFTVSLNTAVGDSMVMDKGTGFTMLTNSTLTVNVEGGVGAAALTIGSGEFAQSVTGTLLSETVQKNVLGGKDIFAVFKITSSNITGFHVGQLAGFDVLSYNPTSGGEGITALKVKGDFAPVVPEPATLSLLVIGLGGLAAGARRKLS